MDYKMEELIPIVADLAKKYAGYDNTSVTYETAQNLMQGVIYCLNECENSEMNHLSPKNLSVMEQYQTGKQLVLDKTGRVLKIYNEMTAYFDDYNVICLHDTVQNGIPAFLKWYDANYFPQNTILTLDYPILENIQSLCGIDAIYKFLCAVQTEQKFLKQFDRNYIISVLTEAVPDYTNMIENICRIVFLNTIGHLVIGKPFFDSGFSLEEYTQLSDRFSLNTPEEIELLLQNLLQKMAKKMYACNHELYVYLCRDIKNMAVRIDTAVKHKTLNKIFIL